MILLLAIALIPPPVNSTWVDHVDELEINTVYQDRNDEGKNFTQVIAWGYEGHQRKKRCHAFKILAPSEIDVRYDHKMRKYCWRFRIMVKGASRTAFVYSPVKKTSRCWSSQDPEMANRELLRKENRRGLFPSHFARLGQKFYGEMILPAHKPSVTETRFFP